MPAPSAASSAPAIEQGDALPASSGSVENAQEEEDTFYDAVEPLVQGVTAVPSNTGSIGADDPGDAPAVSSSRAPPALPPVRPTIPGPAFDSSLALDRLYAYRYTQWRDSREEYPDVGWEDLRQWEAGYRRHQSRQ